MRHHTGAHQADLGHIIVHLNAVIFEHILVLFQHPAGIVQAAQRAGKADVLTAAAAHRLQNNIHIYIVTAQQRKHLKSNTGAIFQTHQRESRKIIHLGNAADIRLFQFYYLLDFCARYIFQTGNHFHIDMVLFRQFHAAVMQHLSTLRSQLQHIRKGNFRQFFRIGHHAGIGSINAVHIRIDLAKICMERRSQRYRTGIRAAAAQCGYIAKGIDPLKTCHDNNISLVQFRLNALLGNFSDARIGIGVIGLL